MSEATTAQRIAERAARAEAFRQRNVPIGKWAENRWDDASVAAFAESELRAERMECAKTVCGYCGELENNLHPASRLDDGSWVHRSKLSERIFDCEAAPIHERAAIWSLTKGVTR